MKPWEKYQEQPKAKPWERYSIDVDALPPNPVEGMSVMQKGLSGVGKGMTDYVYGAGNLVRDGLDLISPKDKGLGLTTGTGADIANTLNLPTRQDIDIKRSLDAPLKATTEGGVGEFIGKSSLAAPLSLIPGANTSLGSTLVGATIGAVEPVGTNESRTNNVAGGAVGGFVGNKFGRMINNNISGKVATNAKMKSQNMTQDQTVAEAKKLGLKLPQSELTNYQQSSTRNTLQGLSGKAATKQAFSQANQQATNSIARKTLGLSDDTPLSRDLLKQLREPDLAVYDELASLPKTQIGTTTTRSPGTGKQIVKPIFADGNQLRNDLKIMRDKATAAWNEFKTQNTQTALNDAKNFTEQAKKLEDTLEEVALKNGDGTLVNRFRLARKNLAVNYTLDDAMDAGTGNIDMRAFAKRFDAGQPLTGDLLTLGKFTNSFKGVTQPPNQAAGAGLSALEPMMQGVGLTTSAATGSPAGLFASGVPLLRGPARNILLSDFMNKAPAYGGGVLNASSKVSPLLPYLGTVGGGLLGATN